jgi:hypothetical protein
MTEHHSMPVRPVPSIIRLHPQVTTIVLCTVRTHNVPNLIIPPGFADLRLDRRVPCIFEYDKNYNCLYPPGKVGSPPTYIILNFDSLQDRDTTSSCLPGLHHDAIRLYAHDGNNVVNSQYYFQCRRRCTSRTCTVDALPGAMSIVQEYVA